MHITFFTVENSTLMFQSLKNSLTALYTHVTQKVSSLFTRTTVDADTIAELERILLQADTGYTTTQQIMQAVKKQAQTDTQFSGQQLKELLERELKKILIPAPSTHAPVYLLVGINGSGKTTTAAKIARLKKSEGKKVLLVAADTFRAAAVEQLERLAQQEEIALVKGVPGADPGSVIFTGCAQFSAGAYDCMIIDTAGRLQTKVNLMNELTKLKKIITKQLPHHTVCTLLTIDAMLGQNSLEQARLFHEATEVNGILLTKMDGTAKGGIVFAINHTLRIPVYYLSIGEHMTDIVAFDPTTYVKTVLDA
ncbi:MAG: signal recognition particle-docking protein FtsY [Candidatus Babeliales bacterium]